MCMQQTCLFYLLVENLMCECQSRLDLNLPSTNNNNMKHNRDNNKNEDTNEQTEIGQTNTSVNNNSTNNNQIRGSFR